jgi:protein O-mannosyl-transferase
LATAVSFVRKGWSFAEPHNQIAARVHHISFQTTPLGERTQRWLAATICVFLAIITWIVFAQTLRHDFVNYDDDHYVYQNAKITSGISLSGIGWAVSHVHSENWHPLTTISHMLDCQWYGLKAGGHHFTNVLLHTIAVILLFLVLREMTGALWQSAFVAAVFAIHPLHVESVAWVAERKDVLSGVFFMLTLLAYVGYVRAASIGRYLGVVLLCALGLMSKPMLVTLPFVLLLVDYWPLNRCQTSDVRRHKGGFESTRVEKHSLARLIVEKIPLVALSIISSGVTLLAQKQAIGWIEELPLGWRLENAAVSYVLYVWQMLWPVKLAVFYPHPENRLPMWEIILALVGLIAVTAGIFSLQKKRPYLVTGWLWYLVMLVPVIGIIQVGWQGRADRYTYLPQIGLYILIAWAVADLSVSWRYRREILGTSAAIIIVILIWRAWIQTSFWRNSETLWSHTLAVTSDNDVAQNNLGIVLLAKGRLEEAIPRFEAAVNLRPENAPAHDNLAKAFLQKGQIAEAMLHYRKLLEIQPENVGARNILGTVLVQQGRVSEALELWEETLAIEPENGDAMANIAWVLATSPQESLRNGARAVELAEQALRLSGGKNPLIFRTLAAAYAESGRFPEAIENAKRALELANSQGNVGLVTELQNTIVLYQAERPLRDPSLAVHPSSP